MLPYIGKKKTNHTKPHKQLPPKERQTQHFTCFLHSDILSAVNGKLLMPVISCLKNTIPALCCQLHLERCEKLETDDLNGGQKTYEHNVTLK